MIDSHCHLDQIMVPDKDGKLIRNACVIATARNPYDLLVSIFCHGPNEKKLKVLQDGFQNMKVRILARGKEPTFENFIKIFCANDYVIDPAFNRFLFMQPFDNGGNCLAHFFIRYEYLNRALSMITKTSKKRPRKNISVNREKRSYKDFYTSELIEMVAKKCERELSMFQYDFDGPLDDDPVLDSSMLRYSPIDDPDYDPNFNDSEFLSSYKERYNSLCKASQRTLDTFPVESRKTFDECKEYLRKKIEGYTI